MMGETEGAGMKIKNVYHSLDAVLATLAREEFSALQEVKELLDVFRSSHPGEDIAEGDAKYKPLIVLEGLDASGKTTVGKELCKALGGIKLGTPTDSLLPLRTKFDAHPMVLRRAYYALGNYMAAYEINHILKTSPVILDRFWHSSTAYTIATEVDKAGLSLDALPPPGDPIYNWPQDLKPLPDVVFFLEVNEEVRMERISRRKQAVTDEEKHMGNSAHFRSLLETAYKRMEKPQVTIVDSNQPVQGVVKEILNFMKEKMKISL